MTRDIRYPLYARSHMIAGYTITRSIPPGPSGPFVSLICRISPRSPIVPINADKQRSGPLTLVATMMARTLIEMKLISAKSPCSPLFKSKMPTLNIPMPAMKKMTISKRVERRG